MPELRFQISISLDGFLAGPDQSVDNPLGIRGEELHEWALKLASWNEAHGREGGKTGVSNDVLDGEQTNIGAVIMGRGMFGGGPGPWGDDPWTGWWGDEPPFRTPVYVLTNYEREPLTLVPPLRH